MYTVAGAGIQNDVPPTLYSSNSLVPRLSHAKAVESLGPLYTCTSQGRHQLIARGREADPLKRLCRFLSRAVNYL